jgi:nucleoside-diphosphate-sugar epimerase
MKILITGGEGFVGRHFVKKFDGHDVTIIDVVHKNPCDARDFFRKDNTHYNLVIHLAAVVGGRATIEGSPLSVAVDLSIDSEAFQWAIRTRPDHFVYYSSSAAYPVWLQQEFNNGGLGYTYNDRRLVESDIDSDDLGTPDLTYGWSKLTGEVLAQYAQKEGVKIHVFRPFSGYGSDQALDYPFPSFIARAKRKDDPFEIWGNGRQTRDWIHIDDIVDATLAAIDADVIGPVNICSGIPTSFNELAKKVTKAAGYTPEFNHILEAPKGVHYRVGDPTKLNKFYTPKISLDEGIWRALNN